MNHPVVACLFPLPETEPDSSQLACLSRDEQQRANNMRHRARRLAFLCCRVKLRQLIAESCHCLPQTVILAVGKHGKPICRSHPIHFSISHSQQLALIAIAPIRIGADVEQQRPLHRQALLMQRILHPAEQTALQQHPETFWPLWVAKEAVCKADGRGITMGLERIHVTLPQNQASYTAADQRKQHWFLHQPPAGLLADPWHACIALASPSLYPVWQTAPELTAAK